MIIQIEQVSDNRIVFLNSELISEILSNNNGGVIVMQNGHKYDINNNQLNNLKQLLTINNI